MLLQAATFGTVKRRPIKSVMPGYDTYIHTYIAMKESALCWANLEEGWVRVGVGEGHLLYQTANNENKRAATLLLVRYVTPQRDACKPDRA